MKITAMAAAVLALATAASPARAQLAMAKVFADHMVLQRQMNAPVWGTAKAGESVTVEIADKKASAVAGKDGTWQAKVGPLEAGGPYTLKVTGGGQTVAIQDVLVGDVWLCGGQSNMAFTLTTVEAKDEIASADFPKIRHGNPPSNLPWLVCSPADAGKFSAVAYYFAKRLHQETGVPIGLLNIAVDGANIVPWTPPEGSYYLQHTLPLVPFGIKGMIWYQGESDAGDGDLYVPKMKALVEGLRKSWGQGDFPVYFTQLAPYHAFGFHRLRMAQLKCLSIPNTGMAVTIDIGCGGDLHPKNKLDVGNRLALWALAKDYGRKDLAYSGPLYKAMKVEGDKIRITFNYVGKGLMVGTKDGTKPAHEIVGGKLAQFMICGPDKKWLPADAVIDGETVVVSSPEVKAPVAVHYAYCERPDGCNLYNQDGLPASPFRTEEEK